MPTITKLKLLNGECRGEWITSRYTLDSASRVWTDARSVIADWADCSLAEIDTIENDFGGEFITVDGIPVAYLEREHVRPVVDLPVPSAPVDLRPLLAAE